MGDVQSLAMAALWVVVIVQAFLLVVMLRHIGVLYERIGPVGALTAGSPLKIGARAPELSVKDLDGQVVKIGRPSSSARTVQLLLFISPSCPICAQLTSFVYSFVQAERGVELILASDGATEDHRAYVTRQRLVGLPYVVSSAIGLAYSVSKLPYAVAIDADGVVRAKGLVNSREHLESLILALEEGVTSLQEWRSRNKVLSASAEELTV